MDLLERLAGRPPVSWTMAVWDRLMRPIRRRRERRNRQLAAEYDAVANLLRAVGRDDAARVLGRQTEKLAGQRERAH
jgi:hypothetical protein